MIKVSFPSHCIVTEIFFWLGGFLGIPGEIVTSGPLKQRTYFFVKNMVLLLRIATFFFVGTPLSAAVGCGSTEGNHTMTKLLDAQPTIVDYVLVGAGNRQGCEAPSPTWKLAGTQSLAKKITTGWGSCQKLFFAKIPSKHPSPTFFAFCFFGEKSTNWPDLA